MYVVVYAICKNESQFVERWMNSMSEADKIVVLDTGSSDDTVNRLRSKGAYVKEQKIIPWRFDTARNISLSLVPDDADICVCTDLDEVFDKGWRKSLEKVWKDGVTRANYRYTWSFTKEGKEGVVFWAEKIHSRHGYKWTHPVHEVLEWCGDGVIMMTMMIPPQVMVVPQYIILKQLHLINTKTALVLPWIFGGAFFIFLMVQFFRGIPRELDEAAEIDGCGKITTLFRILVPVVKPAIITSSIFAFYWIWQDFFQPLIFMNSVERFTIPLALNMYLDPNSYNNYGGLFAMSVISLLPVIIFFIIFQRYLVDGIAMDGIKG